MTNTAVYARNLDNQIIARHAASLYLKLGLLVATATGAWMGHSLARLAVGVFGHLVTAVGGGK